MGLLSEMHRLCRLRSTLEAFAADALRGHPEREAVLAAMALEADALKTAAARADYDAFHRHDLAFHRTLITAAGLPALSDGWERVSADLDQWLQNLKRTHWPSLMTLHYEHVLVLEALRSPFAWVGERALHQHIEAGWYRIALREGEVPGGLDPVAKAEAFFATHFASDFTMEFVARNVSFVSLSHLNRLFRQKSGTSPYAALRRIRMNHAAELLLGSDESVGAVATRVGYGNPSHFIRDFRTLLGTTPARYRKGGKNVLIRSSP